MKTQGQNRSDPKAAPETQDGQADRKVVEVQFMDYRRMRPFDLNFQVVRLTGPARRA